MKKTGRKQRHHIDSRTGQPVLGLSRQTDGRWRIIGTAKKFTEPDEQKAIAKFKKLADAGRRFTADESEVEVYARTQGKQQIALTKAQWWEYAATEIRARPKWVAKQTGIEEIGYFRNIKKPTPLPTLEEIEAVWREYFAKSKEQKRRVLHAWKDFKTTSGIGTLDDITPEVCITYRDAVYGRNLSGKMQSNIFTRIRRMITFAKSRAIATKELSALVENLKLLVPNETTTSLDPMPIEVADWKKLLASAEGDNKAMILLMLNGGFYLQEVVRLNWSDVKGNCLVTHRHKEGKCIRACALWKETLKALVAIPKKGDRIFYTYAAAPLGVKGADKRFRTLRDDAKLSVTSSQLRDGDATAAGEANVNERLINLLLGHRTGMNDHYIKRNPKMVAPATTAVYNHYMKKII